MQRSVARTLMFEFVVTSAAPSLKPFRKSRCSTPGATPAVGPLRRQIGRHPEAGRGGLLRHAVGYFRADAGFGGI